MNYWNALFREFEKESDRAAVILTASIADELLHGLVAARLVPVSSSNDDLFDGANAPLGTFSARIEIAYRLGLISGKFARDLHLIRRIRNDFAHNIQGCSFDDAKVKSRVVELNNSHGIITNSPKQFKKPLSVRDQFLEGCSWMIYCLETIINEVETFKPCGEEWGYGYSHDEEKRRLALENAAKRKVREAKPKVDS
jgi:DNA-binding MltR family transcriptional regulator